MPCQKSTPALVIIVGEVKEFSEEKVLLDVQYKIFRGTNTGHAFALYSLKKHKFINYARGKSFSYYHYYRLLPGHYLEFGWSYWNKRDPSNWLQIALVELETSKETGKGGLNTLHKVIIEYNTLEELENITKSAIVIDFASAVPRYHGDLRLDVSKVYPEDETKKLLTFVTQNAGGRIIAGIENE